MTEALLSQLATDPGFARFMRASTTPDQQLLDDVGAEPSEADGDALDGPQDGLPQADDNQDDASARAAATADDATRRYAAHLKAARFAPLSPEREALLGRQAMAGDAAARAELIERNLRFASAFARRFIKTGRPLDDLIQAATEGLMTAAAKFDPSRGRFTTVAGWWIRNAIQCSVRKDDTLPIPAHLPGLESKLRRQAAATECAHERAVLTKKACAAAERFAVRRQRPVSLQQPVGDDADLDALGLVECDEPPQDQRLEQRRLLAKIGELAQRLGDPRATAIFLMRVGMHPDYPGEARRLGEIGAVFELSRERVRQIYAQAAGDIATAMEYWAQGADNLPAGFRKYLLNPDRA